MCHAVNVTTPITEPDPLDIPLVLYSGGGIRPGGGALTPAWKDDVVFFPGSDWYSDHTPPTRQDGDGQRSLAVHYKYDRARKRKAAGLRQLDESTGDWAG